MELPSFVIICGHYGCGKTNLSLNLAVAEAKLGKRVTLVDLDVVNPYFRSSDYERLTDIYGIRLIAPKFAGSTLDAPGISGEVSAVFDKREDSDFTIIDAGGDPVGATVLGRFSHKIKEIGYEMLYVINKNRPMTASSADAAALLPEIEAKSRLSATGVVNNTHLMSETTRETVVGSMRFARETARRLELPLVMVTAPREIATELRQKDIFPIDIYVKTPW
jgi:MinD superfamily P-loop ATPase